MQIRPCQTPNPEPINMKFGVADDVSDITSHTKIQMDRPSGGDLAYR